MSQFRKSSCAASRDRTHVVRMAGWAAAQKTSRPQSPQSSRPALRVGEMGESTADFRNKPASPQEELQRPW